MVDECIKKHPDDLSPEICDRLKKEYKDAIKNLSFYISIGHASTDYDIDGPTVFEYQYNKLNKAEAGSSVSPPHKK